MKRNTTQTYRTAREAYAALGIDTDKAIAAALKLPVSMHCWQVDDVTGFEVKEEAVADGGLVATGNHPGRARTPDEARADYDQVLKLVPGSTRLNIHAIYAETRGRRVDRDALEPRHFAGWMDWGRARKVKSAS